MAQSSEPRNRNDLTHFSLLDRPLFWSFLPESEMRSVFVVVVDIGPDHSPNLALIDRDREISGADGSPCDRLRRRNEICKDVII